MSDQAGMFTINSSPMKPELLKRLYIFVECCSRLNRSQRNKVVPTKDGIENSSGVSNGHIELGVICLLCRQDLRLTRAEKALKLSPDGAEIEITEEKQILKVPFFSKWFAVDGKFSSRLTLLDSLSELFPGLSGTGRAKVLLN